jgi:hypothetical protein
MKTFSAMQETRQEKKGSGYSLISKEVYLFGRPFEASFVYRFSFRKENISCTHSGCDRISLALGELHFTRCFFNKMQET